MKPDTLSYHLELRNPVFWKPEGWKEELGLWGWGRPGSGSVGEVCVVACSDTVRLWGFIWVILKSGSMCVCVWMYIHTHTHTYIYQSLYTDMYTHMHAISMHFGQRTVPLGTGLSWGQ